MAKRSKKIIRKSAWHEAGHATHCLATIDRTTLIEYGHPAFKGIWVSRDTDEESPVCANTYFNDREAERGAAGAVLSTGKQIFCNDRTEIANLMAGLAGERILRGTKTAGRATTYAFFSGCMNDFVAAEAVVKRHNNNPAAKFVWLSGRKTMDFGLQNAWETLRRYHEVHRRIAEHLIQHGYMRYEEAKALWERHWRECQ